MSGKLKNWQEGEGRGRGRGSNYIVWVEHDRRGGGSIEGRRGSRRRNMSNYLLGCGPKYEHTNKAPAIRFEELWREKGGDMRGSGMRGSGMRGSGMRGSGMMGEWHVGEWHEGGVA